MGKVVIFVSIGLVLLGVAGLILFPNVRADIFQRIPFLGGGNKHVTLTYWGLWEPKEVIQPLIDEYQQINPNITIEYSMRDPASHYETLQSRLGSEGAPDIVRIHSSWVPYLINKLAPLTKDVMSVEEYEATFFPVNQVLVKNDDSYYGLPLMVDGLALVYNRDLFAEEGIANPPKNWIELREMAARLTKKNTRDEITQSGVALGRASNIDYFSDILGLMFAQNGVQFTDSEGKVSFHTSTSTRGDNLAAEAFSYYTLFSTTEKSWDPRWKNSTQEFIDGRVAMVLLPSHRLHEVLVAKPGFAFGVVQAPQLPSVSAEAQAINWANYWVEGVSKVSSNSKEAWKFLKWISEKEQLTKLYRLAATVRNFGEPYPRSEMVSLLSSETYVLPYAQQGATYTTWLFNYGSFSPVNDKIVDALEDMVERTASGELEHSSALKIAADRITGVLNEAASSIAK